MESSSNSSSSSNFLDTTSSDGSDGRRRPVLCARQKLALFAKTGYSDERALEIGIDIDMDFMKEHGVTAVNVRSAKLTCLDLKALGLASALGLRELGFDALDLNNPSFCASAVAAFGAQDVTRTFLLDAGDATALGRFGSNSSFTTDDTASTGELRGIARTGQGRASANVPARRCAGWRVTSYLARHGTACCGALQPWVFFEQRWCTNQVFTRTHQKTWVLDTKNNQ